MREKLNHELVFRVGSGFVGFAHDEVDVVFEFEGAHGGLIKLIQQHNIYIHEL